jgi:predicted TIM-barrel fold metal-dependent hydrolase
MKIIDAHTHIWPREKHARLIRWAKRCNSDHYYADENSTPDSLIEEFMENGIEEMINMVHPVTPEETVTLNRFNSELAKKYKCIHPLASIVPGDGNKEDLLKQAFFELGLMGLKIHPPVQKTDLDDPDMEEVWSLCEKWGRPIFFHTGFDAIYDNPVDLVSGLRRILGRHPELNVVLCHSFFPFIEKAFRLADDFHNVFLDLTGVPVSMKRVEIFAAFGADLERTLKEKVPRYAERILMGSDHPVAGGTLGQVYEDLWALDLGEDLTTRLVHTNQKIFIERFRIR